MATRSMVQFGNLENKKFQRTAQIYHHWDGYPESRLVDIQHAIETAHKAYGSEPGFSYRLQPTYPSDLAAFYILANKTSAGNVDIDENMHGDIEYLYQVWQDDDTMDFYVNILEPSDWKTFCYDPKEENLEIKDTGELKELISKYTKVSVEEA